MLNDKQDGTLLQCPKCKELQKNSEVCITCGLIFAKHKKNEPQPNVNFKYLFLVFKIAAAVVLGQAFWIIIFSAGGSENHYIIIPIIIGLISAIICRWWSYLTSITSVPIYLVIMYLNHKMNENNHWETILFIPVTIALLASSWVSCLIIESKNKENHIVIWIGPILLLVIIAAFILTILYYHIKY